MVVTDWNATQTRETLRRGRFARLLNRTLGLGH